ncbi:MAG: serine/threonine-protein phosphatase [Anaerolineae bacterium]|nr:serine/threonine-protein phosphatase [Anaerolineae bacterium]
MNTSKPDMYFHYAGVTDTGLLRSHNEDAYQLPVNFDGDTLAQRGYFYVLADGMGGHQKGEVASRVTIQTTFAEYYAAAHLPEKEPQQAIIEAMIKAIEQANLQVMQATEGGGTTIVAALLYHDLLVVMNIGDSRAYLLRNNELQLISRDHSLVSRLRELGKITAEEALNHPRQNVLYQALGQDTDLEIHTFTDRLQLDDTIILCSDGLWGPVGDAAIKEALCATDSPLEAAKQLTHLANASGGPDNITTIIIKVRDTPPPEGGYVAEMEAEAASTIAADTRPTPVVRLKPTTLPEGKFYTDRNL